MSKLTKKQQLFVAEYLVDYNATQAAIRAGYSVKRADAIGYENLRKPEIQAAINSITEERLQKLEITSERVLDEIAKIGFSSIKSIFDEHGRLLPVHSLPDRVAASISSIKFSTKTIPGTDPVEVDHIAEIKMWDKKGSLELLGKYLKLFTDKFEHSGSITLEQLITGF